MRIVIQRVSEAEVAINNAIVGEIQNGLLILLGIEHEDTKDDADYLIQKITALRVFGDENGKMNRSIKDVNGSFLVVSQFTLHASTKKGNRPSFINAARPENAIPLYEYFKRQLQEFSACDVHCGEFGADMKVKLTNDGPVTIIMDSKRKE
jgi:D-tyrosyl-tRNA(Tyr) deacylase